MAAQIKWNTCVSQGIVFRAPYDPKKVQQLSNMAKLRLRFWGNQNDERFISLKVEAYYEVIKELVLAHMCLNPLNCSNHICLIMYIREKLKYPKWDLIDDLRKARNAISYRGLSVKNDFLLRNQHDFDIFINGMIERLS